MSAKLKSVVTSEWFKIIFSIVLIIWAFHRINLMKLLGELKLVNPWIVILLVFYLGITMFIGGLRWSLIVLPKVGWKDVWRFTKATYLGGFYSLFFPSAVGGDLLKWIPLMEKYPEISKTRLAASVLIDRVIGFTAFAIVALLALIAGKFLNYQFPEYILWLFLFINMGVIIFYGMVYLTDFEKILSHVPYGNKVEDVVSILKKENKGRIFRCLLLSCITEPVWILASWFYAKTFHIPLTVLQIFIFIPIISLILVLPISFAGFGARENLYLFFFSQFAIPQEKLLLMSTFGGIIGILNALIGGILLLLNL